MAVTLPDATVTAMNEQLGALVPRNSSGSCYCLRLSLVN